jgi:Na+/melibiose symporter-like transporter
MTVVLGIILITFALTIMCHAVGDGHILHAFLYVLAVYGVLGLFGAGALLIVNGIG